MSFYFSGNVQDQNLIPVVGAEIYVYAGGVLATGLQDAEGNPLSNPILSGANGFYEAYSTEGGSHVLRFYWGGRLRYIESIGEAVIQGPVTVTTITGTAHTLTRANAYASLVFTSDSDITLTFPPDAANGFPLGAGVEFIPLGEGQITFAEGDGVTVLAEEPFNKSRAKNGIVGARKIDANTYIIGGALSA